jgi:outer membrane lipoprotein SlyB
MKLATTLSTAAIGLLVLGGCAFQTQNRYNYNEVGKVNLVEFGTVVNARQIDITGENTGGGALLGGGAGAAAGAQFGSASGSIAAGLGGAAIGAVAGAVIEQALQNRTGMEYTVTLANGKTVTVAQNIGDKDTIFQNGDRVMVQISGGYQRVLAANALPTEIKRPKGITVTD